MNHKDKIFNYSKNSYKLQTTKSKPINNIKISGDTDHEGLYGIEETTNINNKIYIKQKKSLRQFSMIS